MIAIAITLLVLEIKVPDPQDGGREPGRAPARQWPSYTAYAVSSLPIGVLPWSTDLFAEC